MCNVYPHNYYYYYLYNKTLRLYIYIQIYARPSTYMIYWLSSLVSISLPNHQSLMEQWLACLIHNTRIHGSSPTNRKIKTNELSHTDES